MYQIDLNENSSNCFMFRRRVDKHHESMKNHIKFKNTQSFHLTSTIHHLHWKFKETIHQIHEYKNNKCFYHKISIWIKWKWIELENLNFQTISDDSSEKINRFLNNINDSFIPHRLRRFHHFKTLFIPIRFIIHSIMIFFWNDITMNQSSTLILIQ